MRATRLVLLLLILPSIAPVADAQTKTQAELSTADGAGDVRFGPSAPGGFPPAMPPTALTDYVDLTGLRVYDESMDGIRIATSVQTLSKSPGAFSSHFVEVAFNA